MKGGRLKVGGEEEGKGGTVGEWRGVKEGCGGEGLTCFDAPLQELSPGRRRLMTRCQHKSDSQCLARSVKPRYDKEIRRCTCSKKRGRMW